MGIFADKSGRTEAQNMVAKTAYLYDASGQDWDDRQAQKAYAYYKNETLSIYNYLYEYLSKVFRSATLDKMPLVVVNSIPKIVKRLTLAYKQAPVSANMDDETYALVNRNLNKMRKEFHRQAKLFNTILVRPIYDEEKEMFTYSILYRGVCKVETEQNKPYKMKELTYEIAYKFEGEDKEQLYTIHWTADNHYATKIGEDKVIVLPGITPEDGKNPYKRIPWVDLRLEDCSEFWGDGMVEVVQGNEHINAHLTDMHWKQFFSFGVPLGVNLGIKASEFVISPDMPVMVENARIENTTPSLDFITPDHKTDLDRDITDWLMNEYAISKGLSPGSFAETETPQSGYAKTMENLELLDLNQDDQEALRLFEYELYEMQALELETVSTKKYTGDLDFEFSPIEFPKSDEEIWLNREKEFQYNMTTPVDWMKETSPNADEEEIKKKLEENKKYNDSQKQQANPLIDRFRNITD